MIRDEDLRTLDEVSKRVATAWAERQRQARRMASRQGRRGLWTALWALSTIAPLLYVLIRGEWDVRLALVVWLFLVAVFPKGLR